MANNKNNVNIKVKGTVGIANLVEPIELPRSNGRQYQINIQNPDFSENDMNNPLMAQAIEKLQLRMKQPTAEYPDPSIYITLPEFNQNSDIPNKLRFWRLDNKSEMVLKQNPARGQEVIVNVATFDSTNAFTQQYGYRSARLTDIAFPDGNIQYYTGNSSPFEIAGFKTLSQQGINTNTDKPAEPEATPAATAPQTANPFGTNNQFAGQSSQSTATPSQPSFAMPGQSAPNNQPAPNQAPNNGQPAPAPQNPFDQPAQAAPQNPFAQSNGQPAQTAPQNPFDQNNTIPNDSNMPF